LTFINADLNRSKQLATNKCDAVSRDNLSHLFIWCIIFEKIYEELIQFDYEITLLTVRARNAALQKQKTLPKL